MGLSQLYDDTQNEQVFLVVLITFIWSEVDKLCINNNNSNNSKFPNMLSRKKSP